jgi:Zn-dependent M28 family amino/carboxypeptidase
VERSARPRLAVLGTALTILCLGVTSPAAAQDPNQVSRKLREGVTVQGIYEHLQALQNIANMNGGTRASGTAGYDASVGYVSERLRQAGYDVSTQTFDFAFFRETGPSSFSRTSDDPDTEFEEGTEYDVFDYSGSGTAAAPLQAVDINTTDPSTITSGCEDADFAGFTAGNVALMQRGTCTFGEKVVNAQEAGASGAIIMNQGNDPGRMDVIDGTLGAPVDIPAISVSFDLGRELAQPGTTVSITTQTESEIRPTQNVIADLAPKSDKKAGEVVLVGAHLDSVVGGPGINDNGTGTGAILEIAEELAEGKAPNNPVRFAFWGAEESGLLGSEHYVAELSDEEREQIGLNLNFDMLGSPNFVRFVYDGDGDAAGTAGPEGSGEIEQVFLRYFQSQGLATEPTAFDGRSDYGPFIAEGIPAGGLFSGAEGVKTEEQAAVHGGVAGEAYDRCYHQACDTLSNVNPTGLDQLADAAAHATAVYAYEKSASKGGKKVPATSRTFKGSHAQR